MRVAFFQRIFAHYQWGLVRELAEHSRHHYQFFGDIQDPMQSGIVPIPVEKRERVRYQVVRTWQPATHLAFQPASIRMAFSDQYDVYIFEGAFQHPTTWIGMRIAQARGKRVLLYTHGWRRLDPNPLVRLIRLSFLRRADGLLLYGRRAKSIGLSLGIPSERMYVVLNSLNYQDMVAYRDKINSEDVARFREQFFGDSKLPIVVYVGRLLASKRLDLLVEACAILKKQGIRLGLLIVGDGPEAARLKFLVERLGVYTRFVEATYDEEKLSLLITSSNVMVVPGAVGLAAIHSMTYGTPVITNDDWNTQFPEAEAIFPGRTGGFFRIGDSVALASALMPFLADSISRVQYSKQCMAIVDRYYNPVFMREVFDRAVDGLPADDMPLLRLDKEFQE